MVLKGNFSNELRDALMPLLLQRQQTPNPPGQLSLISNKPDLFPLIPTYQHNVTEEFKKNALVGDNKELLKFFKESDYKKSLAELKAMLRHFKANPEDKGGDAWYGFINILASSGTPTPFDLTRTEETMQTFNKQRLDAVKSALKETPIVFIAGKTGIGKTHFIHHQWKQHSSALYIGENNALAWAKDETDGIKTLFIDEANISSQNWTAFDGLFNNPPGILIDNEYIRLTPEHKVIFAGNPLSYGGERKLPDLFQRHANCVVFNPLPPEHIYREIVHPIFTRYNLNAIEVGIPLLELADFLSNCSTDKVLISPREIGMMAQLIVAYCQNNPQVNPVEVAQHYVHSIGKNLVPDEFKDSFSAKYPLQPLLRTEIITVNDILITPNNREMVHTLLDFLRVRALRQNNNELAQHGLGGLIIEGPPGVGKSELVVKTLVACDFIKGNLNQDNSDKNVFYIMPASMSLAEKESLLYKAFHEGAVVVIDEINSSPMMERLLNALLMGKTPEGEPPKKQGFMIIGTQNPSSMAGRIKATQALQRRMHHSTLSEYPKQEIIDILVHKGLDKFTSNAMIAEYLTRKDLCFRDVLTRAEQELRAKAQQSDEMNIEDIESIPKVEPKNKEPKTTPEITGTKRKRESLVDKHINKKSRHDLSLPLNKESYSIAAQTRSAKKTTPKKQNLDTDSTQKFFTQTVIAPKLQSKKRKNSERDDHASKKARLHVAGASANFFSQTLDLKHNGLRKNAELPPTVHKHKIKSITPIK